MGKNEKFKIAIQGELGAYSHIAANNLFNDAEIKTGKTFEETFKKAYEDENKNYYSYRKFSSWQSSRYTLFVTKI